MEVVDPVDTILQQPISVVPAENALTAFPPREFGPERFCFNPVWVTQSVPTTPVEVTPLMVPAAASVGEGVKMVALATAVVQGC